MTTDDPLLAALAPAVRAFFLRHRLPPDALRPQGRLLLMLDGRIRMQVVPAPHQRLALVAELLPLSPVPYTAESELLLRLVRMGTGLLRDHAATVCIDDAREALVLQQLLPATADLAAFEDALGAFANALSFWHSLCEEERQETP